MGDSPYLIEIPIEPKRREDRERLSAALNALAAEDRRFGVSTDRESGIDIVSGACEADLEALADMVETMFEIGINVGVPQIAYRETLSKPVTIRYTHKKIVVPNGQFAEVTLEFEPIEPNLGFVFENGTPAGAIPKEFIPAIEKGLRAQKETGLLAGFPVVDFKARFVDGKYHEVDSNPIAFEIAARAAFRALASEGAVKLLEPYMKVVVITPDDFLGDVIGDLNSRRALVKRTDTIGNAQMIVATAPLATMFGYINTLNSLTQGRARFTMEFDSYQDVSLWNGDGGDNKFPPAMAMRA